MPERINTRRLAKLLDDRRTLQSTLRQLRTALSKAYQQPDTPSTRNEVTKALLESHVVLRDSYKLDKTAYYTAIEEAEVQA